MSCNRCGGTGEVIVCIDDLCHGQEECIHGDPPVTCPDCGGNDREPDYDDFDDDDDEDDDADIEAEIDAEMAKDYLTEEDD